MRCRIRRQRTRCNRQQRRQAHYAFCRWIRGGWRAQGGRPRQASGYHQPQKHRLQHQALHGRKLEPGGERGEPRALHGSERGWLSPCQHRRPQVYSTGNFGHGAAEDEEDRRGLSRPGGDRRGDYRSRLLLRLSAPGHEGGRTDCRSERAAHRERAHRSRPGLWCGQGQQGHEDCRVRPRWRYV